MNLAVNNAIKSMLLISGLFICGLLAGDFWHYLGDKNNIVNRYLEAHNSRFIGDADANQIYYVFYNDFEALNQFTDSHTDFNQTQASSLDRVATVSIDKESLPYSLNTLREQEFVRFVFPGTFPFVCH